MMKLWICIICLLILAGCASGSPIDTFNTADLRQRIEITNSPYERYIVLDGLEVNNQVTRGLTLDIERFWLKTAINKQTGEVNHSVHLIVSYHQDWRYYENAAFLGGDSRQLTVIHRNVENCTGNMFVGCKFLERVALPFTDEGIRKLIELDLPIHFKVQSRYKGIDTLIHLPVNYLKAQIEATDEVLGKDVLKNMQ